MIRRQRRDTASQSSPRLRRQASGSAPSPASAASPGHQQLHVLAVATVARRATRAGCRVARVGGHQAHDLLVDGLRIAVRAARVGIRRHRVVVRGRPYAYDYPDLQWNCHAHGRAVHARVDGWVFCWRDRRRWRCYVVPSGRIRGVTLALHPRRLDPRDRSPHWLCQYEDAWRHLATTTGVAA